MSSVTPANFTELVIAANEGSYQLPQFQREWKWQTKHVMNLFDSVRLGFPIGAFLVSETNQGLELGARNFRFSLPVEGTPPQKLILDGQQRLTAGVQLFIGKSAEQKTHYFLDLSKIETIFANFVTAKGLQVEQAYDDEELIESFLEDLDTDDGYIVAKRYSGSFGERLVGSHLLHTPLLFKPNNKRYEVLKDEYLEKYPSKKKLLRNVVEHGMKVDSGPTVPQIIIPAKRGVEAVSRIFATLNTTGKVLSPFELVVAILFPKGVDLIEDIQVGGAGLDFYSKMDATGEIVLQTAVLLAGKDPKKASLPKTLTKEIWETNKDKAFQLLEDVGKFLSEDLGFSLRETNQYIPYDSIFAPLAYVWENASIASMSDPSQKAKALKKIRRWVVGSALAQHYQEGVHNKQKTDAERITAWIKTDSNDDQPVWLREVRVGSLQSASPKGAIGKTLMVLINRKHPKDPITSTSVNLGVGDCQDHHIFPTRFVPDLAHWDKKRDSANLALNIMRTTRDTNRDYSNIDPCRQVQKAQSVNSKDQVLQLYRDQFINERCIEILVRENKSREDFLEFLAERERVVTKMLLDEFGFEAHGADYEVDSSDVSD